MPWRPARPSSAPPPRLPRPPVAPPAPRGGPRPPARPPPRPVNNWQDRGKQKQPYIESSQAKRQRVESHKQAAKQWEEWEEEDWEEECEEEAWDEDDWQDWKQEQPPKSRQPAKAASHAKAHAWQPKAAAPKAAPPKVAVKARLPEELGFNVSKGVRQKGWEIGQMEDGVRPSEDGEPDVFVSHSYTENCRRVDMALFECNCPNSLTCCSHLYAGVVALPQYRHRAALLWAMRQDLGFRAGGHDFEQVSNGPRGGFEAARRRLKAALLKRLNLEELADGALDASLGLWARVEWLRLGQKPKLEKYWLDTIEKSLNAGIVSTEPGRSFQERLKQLLDKLHMKESELAPLLLALAHGHHDDTRSARWAKVAEKFWSQLVEVPKKEEEKKKGSHSEAELRLAAVSAVLEVSKDPGWSDLTAAEKFWCCEQRLLLDLKAPSLSEMKVPKAGSKELYKSFVELIAEWDEAPPELRMSGGTQSGFAAEFIEREAAMLLSELGGSVTHDPDLAEDALRQLLKHHFCHGEDSDWSAPAKRSLEGISEQDTAPAVLTALGASWPWHTVTDVQATALGALAAAEGWEEVASRAVQVAPSMAELRQWLHWDVIFQLPLGPLRDFLQRAAPRLGLGVFELPGLRFLKLDLSKGTCEAFEAALLSMEATDAAEAMLAFLHSSGGMRQHPLEALKPSYRKVAEQLKEAFATVAGHLLSKLPEPFHLNLEVIQMILEPFQSNETLLAIFAQAAGPAGEHAALMANVPSILRPLAKRLTDAKVSSCRVSAPVASSVMKAIQMTSNTAEKSARPKEVEVSTSSSPAALAAPGSAEELIASIRREEFGFEGEQLSGGALQVKQNARLARALKRLAGELYGSDVHWQLELLQNADDNMYKEGVTPSAEFLLRERNGGEVLFRCNEVGFREADIRAICDIGNSSKVGVAKYGPGGRVVATGEKGLGFKAVFALTDKPKLFSGPYRLEFDATHPSGIGYVLPRWLEEKEDQLLRPSWGSLLRLPLRPELHPRREELFRRLAEALPPSLLLFMKRLQEVSVRGETGGTSSLHVKYAEEQPTGAENRWKEFFGQVKLQVSRDGGASWEMEHWLLLRRHVKVPEGLAKPGIAVSPPSTLLEMALPLDDQGGFQAGRGAQQVFAFLPVRSYGLPFALQADWAVSSSREEILSGCAWNEFLKAELPNLILTLVSSVTSLSASDPLKWSFYSAVPAATSASNFFRPAIVQLQNKLRGVECMLTDEDSFCLPQKAIRCPPEARRCLGPGSPLQQALRSQGLHLLHEKVEAYAPAGLLDSLGVLRLNASQLLRLLPNVEDFPGMSWWRQLLALLDELLDLAPKNDLARLVEVARKLPLLPVQGASLEVSEGLVLPPEQPEAEGFPPELLAELRAVDFRLLSEDKDHGDSELEEGAGALAVARVRKLLRRLNVAALTPRMVVKDILAPLFGSEGQVPRVIAASEAPRSLSALLALGGFLVTHRHLADELRGAPVGWPCGEAKVAVGRAFVAPALHSPSATTFLEAASGVLDLTLPRVPGNLDASLVHQVLEDLGLALPGPRVVSDQEDWKSEDLESLLSAIAKETRTAESQGLARARSLAKALNSAWSRFQRYAFRRNDSSKASTFLLTLQSGCWLPSDGPEAALHRPGELVCGTVEIRSVFPDAQLLKGRMCGVVAGDFAEALGVLTKPTVDLATKVLLSFEHASPVAPESAVAVYGFLQEQGADWSMLRDSPCIVVEQGQAAVMPSEVVWEDPHDAIDAPKLQRLYSAHWRHFFVSLLGVPETPTPDQVLRHVDRLSSSASGSAMWAPLLLLAEDLEKEVWKDLAEKLKLRRCIPLLRERLGTPKDGVFVDDGVLPSPLLLRLRDADVNLAETPPTAAVRQHWPLLCRALGLPMLSSVCQVSVQHAGTAKCSALGRAVSEMLVPAQRYLLARHPKVYHRPEASHVAAWLEKLQVVEVAAPLQLQCRLPDFVTELEADSYLEGCSSCSDTNPSVRLLLVPGASLASICVELARLLVPNAQEDAAHAREALTTFLASVSAGAAEEVCAALQVPPLEADVTPWPMPKEVADQLAAEQRLLEAAEAEAEPGPSEVPEEEEVQEPAAKRARTEPGPTMEDAEESFESSMVQKAAKNLADRTEDPIAQEGSAVEGGTGLPSTRNGSAEGAQHENYEEAEAVDSLLKNISVGKDDDTGDGKGKGKGKGKGGEGKGKGKSKERKADQLGRIFDHLPGREDGEGEPLEEGEEAQLKRKEFKTRIYDLDDLRVQKKRMKIDPLPHENLLPKEEREKVGRWGEQFVYHYLKQKLESEDAGKRVLWVNEIEETGFQYDLRIEDGNGEVDAYVEVKTSCAKDKQLFEMSYREWTFAQKEGGKFVIFRVSNAGKEDVELCSITNPFRQWKEMNLGLCLTL